MVPGYNQSMFTKDEKGVLQPRSNPPRAVVTREAAHALYVAQSMITTRYGYSLLIYDSYRPQKAVNWFVEWSQKSDDNDNVRQETIAKEKRCKENYYPYLVNRSVAFELPDRYVAPKSRHSGGSTVDLTLIKLGSKVSLLFF